MTQIALPSMPWMTCKVEPPNTPVHGLALSRDGRKLWITSVADSGLYVYDTATKKLGKKITVGACPNWMGRPADGHYAGREQCRHATMPRSWMRARRKRLRA